MRSVLHSIVFLKPVHKSCRSRFFILILYQLLLYPPKNIPITSLLLYFTIKVSTFLLPVFKQLKILLWYTCHKNSNPLVIRHINLRCTYKQESKTKIQIRIMQSSTNSRKNNFILYKMHVYLWLYGIVTWRKKNIHMSHVYPSCTAHFLCANDHDLLLMIVLSFHWEAFTTTDKNSP